MIKGYEKYKDDPRIIDLKKEVLAYNKRLFAVGIRDHQVSYAKRHFITVFFTFWYRLLKLACLSILVVPGTALFSLVFIFTKLISIKKSKEALAASNVKIHARDVMATWKLLVAMVVAPVSYAFHVSWVTTLYWYNDFFGYLPPGLPIKPLIIAQIIIYPILTYAALRFGEVGMDIAKSLWPLLKLMSPYSNNELVQLQAKREELVERVNNIINTLGPEMFDDFDSKRIIREPFTQSPPTTPGGTISSFTSSSSTTHRPSSSSSGNDLPRNESYEDLANQDFFSSKPSSPKRAHSRNVSGGGADGFQLQAFSKIEGAKSLEEVSKRIRVAMKRRGSRRSGPGNEAWGEGVESDEDSEEGNGELTMTKKDR